MRDVIEVPMTVSRFKVHVADSMVEVWGYVGDYEVMVCISLREAVEKDLIPESYLQPQPKALRRGRKP